jgi:hypothetical protein
VIPGLPRAGLFLIRTDQVAVAVGDMRAYPNGFEVTIHVRLRQEKFFWGNGPLDWLADPRTRQAPEQALRQRRPMAGGSDRRQGRTPARSTQLGNMYGLKNGRSTLDEQQREQQRRRTEPDGDRLARQ